MIVETQSDAFNAVAKAIMFTAPADKPSAILSVRDGIARNFLAMCEKQLERNSANKFLVGESLTIADFSVASFTFNVLKNEQGGFFLAAAPLLLEFPNFHAYVKRLESELSKHLTTRPKYPM